MENKKPEDGPNRFRVSAVGCDNPAFDAGDSAAILNVGSRSPRMSVPDFFSALLNSRRRSTSLQIPEGHEGNMRRTSRANSIFAEIFKDTDIPAVDYNLEAAPRLENYRNSLTMHKYMVRPSLDQLHDAQQNDHPELTPGKGQNTGAVKFGWIKGVYIRCLLNIWGVMLFLRMGWMTGQCGIILANIIVVLSTIVTVITTLSMSAICTNGDVRGGGAYYMISRSLGPEFGGVVGILLFLANAISGAMYVIGAGEAIRDILNEFHMGIVDHPSSSNDIRISALICLVLMMSITGVGMEFENKTQMLLLSILLVALMDYLVGGLLHPDDVQKASGFLGWQTSIAYANMLPDFRGETFFSVFAVFFPSVTGILAGANISGDLKDPCMAIPRGTLLSIATTSISYMMVIFWLGFSTVRDASGSLEDFYNGTSLNCTMHSCPKGLMNDNQTMKLASGFGPLIYAGIFAATLSSALVSIVSAPRILQALCVDGVIPWLNYFKKGYGADNDPRRGLALTFVIAVVFTCIGDLNAVAPIISNFFMAANGLINFACFHASYVKSPGFRPAFKYYNLWMSLIGAILCVVIMFVMNWITALITDLVSLAIYIYIAKTCPEINWGSSFQGYAYRNALYFLNKLSRVEEHVKNYRPSILVLTGNASSRPQLVDLAGHFTKENALQICTHFVKEPVNRRQRRQLNDLNSKWLVERKVKAFYCLVETDSLVTAVTSLAQTSGIGKMKPNILMMGYKANWQTGDINETLDYFHVIHDVLDALMSLCILRMPGGQDYSSFFCTKNGLPYLEGVTYEQEIKSQPTKAPEIKVSLEPVMEEPDGNPPPYSDAALDDVMGSYHSIPLDMPEDMIPKEGPPDVANMFQGKQPEGTIDVWWLYDDGGLTVLLPYILTTRARFKGCKLRIFSVAQDDSVISEEQLNLAILLKKFRVPFTDVTILSAMGGPLNKESTQKFEKLVSKWLTKDDSQKDPAKINRSTLNTLKNRTNQFLRLRELLDKHSKSANLIVMTLPLPRKQGSTAPLYMAWLEILTQDMPPFLLVRGNQNSVLTFYS